MMQRSQEFCIFVEKHTCQKLQMMKCYNNFVIIFYLPGQIIFNIEDVFEVGLTKYLQKGTHQKKKKALF